MNFLKSLVKKLKYNISKILKSKILQLVRYFKKKSPKLEKLISEIKYFLRGHGLYSINTNNMTRFNGDSILASLIDEIITYFNISSLIETGTFLGATSLIMAQQYSKLPILTCEVEKKIYNIAIRVLKRHKNVRIENISSEKFLKKLFKYKKNYQTIFKFPLIYLDAHWYDFWPLQSEIKEISNELNKTIIVIHDFEVPNNPEFNYYVYLSSDTKKIHCNLSLIKNELNSKNHYSLLYPKYNKKEAKVLKLTGYIIIFQNLRELFNNFINNKLVKKNFFEFKNE